MSSYSIPRRLDETQETFDDLLTRRIESVADEMLSETYHRLQGVEGTVDRIIHDPLAVIRLRSKLYTPQQASDELQIHVETLYAYLRLPEDDLRHLPSIRIGQQYRILPGDLAGWLERNRNGVADDTSNAAD